jgi:acylphosphatase
LKKQNNSNKRAAIQVCPLLFGRNRGIMTQLASLHAIINGRVQGVYFRAFVSEQATYTGITGYVRNLPGGRAVEVLAEGEKVLLEKLEGLLKTGPPCAKVDGVSATWGGYSGRYSDFEIRY